MNAVRVSLLAGLVAASGCCLSVVSGSEIDETSGGGSTSGGGGSTSGGTTTGAMQGGCVGVYCSPSYVCDPTDGICKCGGQICTSGNCDPIAATCLPGCSPDGGSSGIAFLIGAPGEAVVLPPAALNKPYDFQIAACAGSPPVVFNLFSPLPPGLTFYSSGEIEGVPTETTNGVPFEFEVEAVAQNHAVADQNFLLQVE